MRTFFLLALLAIGAFAEVANVETEAAEPERELGGYGYGYYDDYSAPPPVYTRPCGKMYGGKMYGGGCGPVVPPPMPPAPAPAPPSYYYGGYGGYGYGGYGYYGEMLCCAFASACVCWLVVSHVSFFL